MGSFQSTLLLPLDSVIVLYAYRSADMFLVCRTSRERVNFLPVLNCSTFKVDHVFVENAGQVEYG